MYLDQDRLVLSPTDLVGYLSCEHLSTLSLAVASRSLERPSEDDPPLSVVQRRGYAHEAAYLETLRAAGRRVVEIADADLRERAAATRDALFQGSDVVYQATFFDDNGDSPVWRGHADFLTRVERESLLGAFSYEPEDTKLARHVRPSAVIQLCEYAELLARIQGVAPEQIHVVLGGQERISLRLAEFAAYFRAAKRDFTAALAHARPTYPEPVQHCTICSWRAQCDERRIVDDHLSLVAGLSADQTRKLELAGISAVAELAVSAGEVKGIGQHALERLRSQSRLQLRARSAEGPPPYELLPDASPGIGLGGLPEPDAGDLFFDIEGDPYVGDAGLEYLLGVGWREAGDGSSYRAFWSHTPEEEKRSFEAFIDFVMDRRAANPGLHIYHYASYEPNALGKLMGRHGTREAEVDELLRGAVLVDLYRVVRQGIRVGTPSYSLKKLEALYRPSRTEAITDAGSSIVEYERWLEEGDQAILDSLEEYNRIDCESTAELRDWLELRRGEYLTAFGGAPSRAPEADAAPAEAVAAEDTENATLREALSTAGGPSSASAESRRAQSLLGELLDWYRREDRPVWWQFYNRVFDCDEADLYADTEAVAGLEYLGEGDRIRHSVVHRYRFDPAQEFKLSVGSAVCDPDHERAKRLEDSKAPGPGSIVSLDAESGELGLIRGTSSKALHPRNLIPGGPLESSKQREALRRVTRSVITSGVDAAAPYRAVRDLLLRRVPRTTAASVPGLLVGAGEGADDAAVRIAQTLAGGCLAIQGPPGSGKTSTAARIAVALVRAEKTVGVTANSHAVITNLVKAIVDEAGRQGVQLSVSQKSDGKHDLDHHMVAQRGDNSEVAADLASGTNVIAGTAWLFSRPEFDQSLDFLIVDEAGQFSLANAISVGTAATNLILVGDPRQLPQVSTGTHPPGVGISALEHLLDGAETMPADLGIFLDKSHRLHPDICAFISEIVYEGRLGSDAECTNQSIGGDGPLSGSGLRWLPVDHRGNRVSSQEEVEAVRRTMAELIGRPFTNKKGDKQQLGVGDVLIVAPYNAQVAALAVALPKGARIGTVDKFQGQEAAVVIVSLATSDLAEIPRGMDFLYNRNRLNVAVSRAQALTVLVASPSLAHVRCHTVEQLRLANGLCRFLELAAEIPLP